GWTALAQAAQERSRENDAAPKSALWARALAELYPAGSPLSVPPWGGPDAFASLDGGRLFDFARVHARPKELQVVLAGAIEEAQARAALERTLGRWTAATSRPTPSRMPLAPRGPPPGEGAHAVPAAHAPHGNT